MSDYPQFAIEEYETDNGPADYALKEARYKKATAQVDRLTQSILAKPFRGELVPTEAEIARREGRDYEPASALLDRILTERAQTVGRTETRRVARRAKRG